jgi:hypothetical protein
MRIKLLAVCLLALAGTAGIFFAARFEPRDPARPRHPARVLPQRQIQNNAARSVPVPDLRSQRESAKVHGVPNSQAYSSGSGVARFAIPMTFEPNVGQAESNAQFVGRGKGLTVFLTRKEIAFRVTTPATGQNGTVVLRVAGNTGFDWKGEARVRAQSNYFVGNDPKKWHTNVPHFARAETANAARGVGMAVYGNDDGVEYDLHVPPGADVSTLRLTLTGAENLRVNASGDLLMNVAGDEVRMKKPKVYETPHSGWHSSRSRHRGSLGARRARKYSPHQTQRTRRIRVGSAQHRPKRAANPCASKSLRGQQAATAQSGIPCLGQPGSRTQTPAKIQRRTIEGSYVLEADGSIGFRIGPHDPNAALVVDPSLSVAYGTFLGGSGTDTAASLALDPSGKIYVGGSTTSTSFSGALAKRLGPADGPAEFFIAKIDPTMSGASSLIYLTFFGGSGTQAGGLIAVDASGDVAITGTTTATDFPVTDTSAPTSALASGDGNDVAVSEIGPSGSTLVFSTLFGGSGTESQSGPGGIALDGKGDVYISSDVHTTSLDSASADLPVTAGAYQTTWDGEPGDAFLAIFQPPASAGGPAILKYCTYLGIESIVEPGVGGIAVDVSGSAYIAGFTSVGGTPFPAQNAIQTMYGGGSSDAFLMKIAPASTGATDLVYATLLGGAGADQALAVALDSANPPNAYITGTTQSSNFPTNGSVGAYQAGLHPNATANAFLSVVSQNAITGQSALAYSTYFGGSHTDAGNAVAVASPNAIYVTGATTSPDLPWHNNLQPFNGAGDAFIAKLDPTSPGAASLIYVTPLGGTSPVGGTASASGNAVAADNGGHVYVAGATTSGDFPTAVTTESIVNGFQPACASCSMTPPLADAFLAEVAESSTPMPSVYFNVGHAIFSPGTIGIPSTPEPIAVLNGGDTALTISSIQIGGPSAGDFSLIGGSACFTQAISPGSAVKCSFEVGFTPSTAGPEDAVVTVSDNAPGSPQILELVATGQAPLAAVSPLIMDFGNQPQNSTSAPQTITLTNSGTQNLTLTNLVETGPDPGQFAVFAGGDPGSPSCQIGISLAPGGQCVERLAFEPNAQRTFNAEMDFYDNSSSVANSEQIVPLTGVGTVTAPIASLTVPSLVFGNEDVGNRSGAQSVTLTNLGSAPLTITSIALTGANVPDFAIVTNGTTCPVSGGTVIVQAACAVSIQLAPQTAGTKSSTLSFADNAAGSPQQVTLSGTATAAPSLQVSPPSLTFAAQSENTTSASQSIVILNSGGAPAEVSGIAVSGPNAADFSSAASCVPNPVPVGKSCQISVSFTPGATAPGIRSATLGVPTGSPPTVALTGTATQASISVPAGINFGTQLAGGAGGTPQPVTVTNSSSGPFAGALTVTSVSRSGTNAGDFVVASGGDGCTGQSAAPGGACTIQVSFKPLQSATCNVNGGSRSATLSLNDNAPGSPQGIPLSGTASDFCIASSPGQAVVEPITAGQSATYLLEINSSAGFTGSAALSCSVPAALLGTCTIATTPASNLAVVQITPASSGQFQVVVTSTPAGVASSAVAGAAWLAKSMPPRRDRNVGIAVLSLAFLVIWLLALGRLRVPLGRIAQAAALLVAVAITIAACGGGGGTPVPAVPAPGTPANTYTIMVTATVTPAGQVSVTRTFPLSLTVQ